MGQPELGGSRPYGGDPNGFQLTPQSLLLDRQLRELLAHVLYRRLEHRVGFLPQLHELAVIICRS